MSDISTTQEAPTNEAENRLPLGPNGPGEPRAWERPRGPIQRPDGRLVIGRVGAPPRLEATSKQFYFWVPDSVVVEETQLVICESAIADQIYTYYGVIDDVRRQSRMRDMGQEVDLADGDLDYAPPFRAEGITYASVSILRTEPPVLTPPRERSEVYLANAEGAGLAYGADEIDNGLAIGLVKNGDSAMAGPGVIDLNYLLGVNGGHLNVNGSAGRGTKSSYLLTINWLLINEARRQQKEKPSDPDRLRVVPIILNVKGFDLFYVDQWNRRFDRRRHLADWQALGFPNPEPFANVAFYAAQQANNTLPVSVGRVDGVSAYSWSLADVIRQGLLTYLFAESDAQDANFGALVLDLEGWLTEERTEADGQVTYDLRRDRTVATFQELLDWLDGQIQAREDGRVLRNHHLGTWRKLYRRLMKMVVESRGVLRRNDQSANALNVVRADTADPMVIDLAALAGEPDLQRFVVAAVFKELVEARTGTRRVTGLTYLVTVDELNRFAPRGANDPITKLIEMVAAEMRSQGIILLGAQQQASKVSEKVIENSAIRVLGRTGPLELNTPTWRSLSESARTKAASLRPSEKLVIQDNFREPMHIRVPFPVWAMNPSEVRASGSLSSDGGGAEDISDLIEG